jgi:RNA polymerase sigma-70 factor (ECF subfamily)
MHTLQEPDAPVAAPLDDQALAALLRRHEARLGQFPRQLVESRALAEDLLQEVFETAHRCRGLLAAPPSAEAWLFAAARHRALNALRRRRRAAAALARLAGRGRETDARDPAEALAVRDLLLRTLDPDDRMLVVLRYVHGFDAAELARMTDRSPDAVRQRLSRARRRLLAAYEEDA